jgi:hypothetical protein
MNMLWVLAGLLTVVLGALLWVLLRSRPDRTVVPTESRDAPPVRPKPRLPATWGKTIVVPDPANACPAVLRIQGQSFANEAAPRLPLVNCSVANQCKCHFVPAAERRRGEDRRSGTDRRTQLRFEPGKPGDRRTGKDRRHRKGYDWDHTI